MTSSIFQIIVHAPPNAADALIESCGNIRAMTKDIYAPVIGESVRIGQQTNSFSISISDELLASLKMSRVRTPYGLSSPITDIHIPVTRSSRTTRSVTCAEGLLRMLRLPFPH